MKMGNFRITAIFHKSLDLKSNSPGYLGTDTFEINLIYYEFLLFALVIF